MSFRTAGVLGTFWIREHDCSERNIQQQRACFAGERQVGVQKFETSQSQDTLKWKGM